MFGVGEEVAGAAGRVHLLGDLSGWLLEWCARDVGKSAVDL